jgi:hypothetical protein
MMIQPLHWRWKHRASELRVQQVFYLYSEPLNPASIRIPVETIKWEVSTKPKLNVQTRQLTGYDHGYGKGLSIHRKLIFRQIKPTAPMIRKKKE